MTFDFKFIVCKLEDITFQTILIWWWIRSEYKETWKLEIKYFLLVTWSCCTLIFLYESAEETETGILELVKAVVVAGGPPSVSVYLSTYTKYFKLCCEQIWIISAENHCLHYSRKISNVLCYEEVKYHKHIEVISNRKYTFAAGKNWLIRCSELSPSHSGEKRTNYIFL